MAVITLVGSFDPSHAFWHEKHHYSGRTPAKCVRFWKTLVKPASFIKYRFFDARFRDEDGNVFRKEKVIVFQSPR